MTPPGPRALPTLERIQRRCTYEDRGYRSLCLIYAGSLKNGYGQIIKWTS